MNINESTAIVLKKIQEIFDEDGRDVNFDENSSLLGSNSILKSLDLVSLCTKLEDEALSLEPSFEFDWTSEKAMSNLNSIFKTPKTLAEEFNRQANN